MLSLMLLLSWKPIHHDSRLGVGDGSDQEDAILRLLPLFASSSSCEDQKFFIANLLQMVISIPFQSQFAIVTMKIVVLLST